MPRKIRRALVADEAGFTLVELLVVVLIIGILAAVALPTLLSQSAKAYGANAKTDLKNAELLVEAYATGAGGKYPAGSDNLANILAGDAGAVSFAGVSYEGPPSTGDDDNFVLSEVAQDPARTTFWIDVVRGVPYYGTGTPPASATLGAAPASGSTSTGAWD